MFTRRVLLSVILCCITACDPVSEPGEEPHLEGTFSLVSIDSSNASPNVHFYPESLRTGRLPVVMSAGATPLRGIGNPIIWLMLSSGQLDVSPSSTFAARFDITYLQSEEPLQECSLFVSGTFIVRDSLLNLETHTGIRTEGFVRSDTHLVISSLEIEDCIFAGGPATWQLTNLVYERKVPQNH